MAKYACSILATKKVVSEKSGIVTTANNIHHGACCIEAVSRYEATGFALAIAEKLYPAKDGWTSHHANVCPIDNVTTLENAMILPDV